MKKIFLAILFLLASVQGVLADEMMVRLSRMKTGESPIPILVTWKSDSSLLAGTFQFGVGSGWVVNQNLVNIVVSTAGLPSGVTAMPSVSANSVSGNGIVFNRGAITSGINYGFWITGGIGINPVAGDGANYKWRINTTEIKVPVTGNDSVVLTGRVGASASDFQLEIGRSGPSPLSQDNMVEYLITYGSYLPSAVQPLKIVAEWGDGIYNVVDYVVGSGTTAYGGVAPVVDLINRKIEWTISNLPANLQGNEIRFSLRANDSYRGQQEINFPVKVTLYGANVVTTDQSLTDKFQFYSIAVPTTASIENVTTNAPTVTLSLKPTPSGVLVKKINSVEIVELTNNSAVIKLDANFEPKLTRIFYGNSISKLVSKLTSVVRNRIQKVRIDDLLPDKDYYFKLEMVDEDGAVLVDLFTFRTASNSSLAEILSESVLITSQNNVVVDARDNPQIVAQVIPTTDYAYKFKVSKPELVKSVKMYVRNKLVLGVASWVLGAEPGQSSVDLVELSPGSYSGHLVSPSEEGFYEIVIRITGINGSVSEKVLGTIRVSKPFKVVDELGRPIEGVEVNMMRYNPRNKLYETINRENFGYANPLYTDPNGEIKISLPNGQYQAEIVAPGFASKTINFEIGQGLKEKPPTVSMVAEKTKFFGYLTFYDKSKDDLGRIVVGGLKEITSSQRFFKIYSIAVLLVGFGLWSKLLINLNYEFGWGWFSLKKQNNRFFGGIFEKESGLPVVGATVFLIADETKKILDKSLSNSLGGFSLNLTKNKLYKIMATKIGYHPTAMLDYTYLGLKAGNIKIWLKKKNTTGEMVRAKMRKVLSFGLVLPICVLLVIIGGMFFANFGVYRAVIIWLTAIINLYLFFVLNKI